MRRSTSLDESTAQRLLDGRIVPDDAPPGFAGVASLLGAIRADTEADPSSMPGALLDSMVAAIATAPLPATHERNSARRPRMLPELITAKIAAIALSGGMALTGAAAAATGTLPAPAQDAVADAAERVGFDLPGGHASKDNHPGRGDDAETDEVEATDTESTDTESSDTEAADTGAADTEAPEGTKGAEVSDVARNTDATGADKGREISTTASDGRRPTDAGPPSSLPGPAASRVPAGTPVSGDDAEDSTARDAPDSPAEAPEGASDDGTATASDASGGRNDARSGNRPDRP